MKMIRPNVKYQHRIVEAEDADALGDLPDLLIRMRARVARIRLERGDRAHLHRQPRESFAI